jgi:putative oxidoreductase
MLGLGTRAAALISSGSMAYAYFSVHRPGALLPLQNGGEKAALFGAGVWALETGPLLKRQKSEAPAPRITSAATE